MRLVRRGALIYFRSKTKGALDGIMIFAGLRPALFRPKQNLFRQGRVLATMVLLSGCVVTSDGGSAAASPAKAVPTRVAVVGGTVKVAGPAGYCIDTSASRFGKTSAFVLLGSCTSLTGSLHGKKLKDPAILTATVSAGPGTDTPFAATFDAMAKFLASPAGRAALSRSGKASTVKIVKISALDAVMLIHATDTSSATGQEVEADYWRALMQVKGKIVTLTVLGLKKRPVPTEVKHALLRAFIQQMRTVNGG